jgi:CheY-like chemotaxis protein
MSRFVLGQPVDLEESMTCEFKEVKNQPPIQAIGKVIDEYVVAFLNANGGSVYWGIRDSDRRVIGVRLNDKLRDELRQVAGQKLGAIAPPVAVDGYQLPFHQVVRLGDHCPIEDIFVVEAYVRPGRSGYLFLTGGGDAYRRTLGGTKKFTGAELLTALLTQLNDKVRSAVADAANDIPDLAWMPSVARRARVVQSLLRGSHVLWIDDIPGNNLYERTVLSSLGVTVDLALSTSEGIYMQGRLKYDVIISDMHRDGDSAAGLIFLKLLREKRLMTPVIYYVGGLDPSRSTPDGAFAITNRPDELLHYVFDVLERRLT